MNSGATINSETYLLSKEVFTVPFRLSVSLTLSQRVANQTFLVDLVSVDKITLVPDGKHSAAILFDGTTATQAKYRVQNGGLAALDSAASTFPTTAGAGVYEIEPFADECWLHGCTLDSTAGRTNSYRRHQQIPDPNSLYKIRLRWLNGGVAPTTTAAVVQYLAVQDYVELTAEITSGRGNAVAGQGIFATVAGAVTATGITGSAAHDAAGTGSPVKVAGRAINVLPVAVSATGDVTDMYCTMHGALIVKPLQYLKLIGPLLALRLLP